MSRVKLQSVFVFCAAVALGALFARSYHRIKGVSKEIVRWTVDTPHENRYHSLLDTKQLKQTWMANEPRLQVVQEAEYLQAHVRVLCMVMLSKPKYTRFLKSDAMQKASPLQAMRDTWAPRCNKVIYFSHEADRQTHTFKLKQKSLEEWSALREALGHVFSAKYLDAYDWLLVCEQDTFVIMENLRYYLSVYDPGEAHFMGHAFEAWDSTYNAMGPGLVLSKTAARKLQTSFLKRHCPASGSSAESELARCLADAGVAASDTRDWLGRGRFLMYQPEFLLVPGMLPWTEKYWSSSKFLSNEGPDCCSDYAVSFHYVPPNMMYVFDYLVYHLKPYGIVQQLVSPLHSSPAVSGSSTLRSAPVSRNTSQGLSRDVSKGRFDDVRKFETISEHHGTDRASTVSHVIAPQGTVSNGSNVQRQVRAASQTLTNNFVPTTKRPSIDRKVRLKIGDDIKRSSLLKSNQNNYLKYKKV